MKLRSLTEWKTKDGKRRTVRLYKAWRNLNDRVNGHNVDGQGNKRWEGIGCDFTSWQQFREWSLRYGFSKANNSCDRIRSSESYGPNNCRWISVSDNTRYANATHAENIRIRDFQLSPPTESESQEQYEFERLCLGIYHCSASEMNRAMPPASVTAIAQLR